MKLHCTFTYILCHFFHVRCGYVNDYKLSLTYSIMSISDISMTPTSLQYLDWKNSKVLDSLRFYFCEVNQKNLMSCKPSVCLATKHL